MKHTFVIFVFVVSQVYLKRIRVIFQTVLNFVMTSLTIILIR